MKHQKESDGINYELYQANEPRSSWWIRVVDIDFGLVALLVKYPSYDKAKEAFDKIFDKTDKKTAWMNVW